jgi:hypothetical protein
MAQRPLDEITVVDLEAAETGALNFAQLYVDLQKQAAVTRFMLKKMKMKGRGRWIRQLERDVRVLVTYLDTASELSAEICADLDDLLVQFKGEPDEWYDDFDNYGEFPEEFE